MIHQFISFKATRALKKTKKKTQVPRKCEGGSSSVFETSSWDDYADVGEGVGGEGLAEEGGVEADVEGDGY